MGCHAVCFPGCLTGRDVTVYPLCPVRGIIPALSIVKADGCIVAKRE
jgi:hypothetical protein